MALKPHEERKYRIMGKSPLDRTFRAYGRDLTEKEAVEKSKRLSENMPTLQFKIKPEKPRGKAKEARLRRHEEDRRAKVILLCAEGDAREAVMHTTVRYPGWVVLRKSSWFLNALKRMGKAGDEEGEGVLFVYDPVLRKYIFRTDAVYAMRFARTLQTYRIDAVWGRKPTRESTT